MMGRRRTERFRSCDILLRNLWLEKIRFSRTAGIENYGGIHSFDSGGGVRIMVSHRPHKKLSTPTLRTANLQLGGGIIKRGHLDRRGGGVNTRWKNNTPSESKKNSRLLTETQSLVRIVREFGERKCRQLGAKMGESCEEFSSPTAPNKRGDASSLLGVGPGLFLTPGGKGGQLDNHRPR